MFFVWSVDGLRTPYVPGTPAPNQLVQQVSRSNAVEPANDSGSGTSENEAEDWPYAGARPLRRNREAVESYRQAKEGPYKRQAAVLASQIMTAPVITVSSEASLDEAWQIFQDKKIHHLPIIGADGRIVGIVSDHDLLRQAARLGEAAPTTPTEEVVKSTHIKDVMVPRVLTARPDTEIRQVARVMYEERIGAIPIVDELGILVGILTRSDILRTVVHNAQLELWI